MKRILIVKTSALGDIIQGFSVLKGLKETLPDVSIHWVVEKAGALLAERHPWIDKTIVIDSKAWRKNLFQSSTYSALKTCFKELRSERYDAVLDLQGNVKSALILAFVKSRLKVGFGAKSVPEKLSMLATNTRFNPPKGEPRLLDYCFLSEKLQELLQNEPHKETRSLSPPLLSLINEEVTLLEELKATYLNEPFILVSPGSQWPNKELSIETLGQIAKEKASALSANIVLAHGSSHEKTRAVALVKLIPEAKLLPKVTLPLLQHVMKQAKLMISMDSLPLHLAASAGTPTFSFFGPSLGKIYAPIGSHHHFIQGTCPYNITFETRCPYLRSCSTGRCIKDI